MRRIGMMCALSVVLSALAVGMTDAVTWAKTSPRPARNSHAAKGSHWRAMPSRHRTKSHASAKSTAARGTAADPMLFGSSAVESSSDRNASGLAEAFPFYDQTDGTATSISVYVDAHNGATSLIAGLYSNNNGTPGTLIGHGSLAAPTAGAWNVVSLGSTSVASGGTYWVAVLGKGGALYFRDRSNGPCASRTSSSSSLTALPSTWRGARQWRTCPISVSVNGIASPLSPVVTSAPLPALAPTSTAAPTVSGTPQQGQTLTTSDGSWTGLPLTFGYAWDDCDTTGNNCTAITGATSSSYTLTASDVGQTVRSVVTASNPFGSGASSSDPTSPVTPLPPANTVLPSISGSTTSGQTLTTSAGSWTNNPSSYAYVWEDCNGSGSSCTTINGATSHTYTLTSTDVGHTIRSVVTATNVGGSGSATSNQTPAVASNVPNAPANTALPSVSGTATQGQTLTTSNGSWSNSPSSYTYGWQDCNSSGASCSTIAAATSSSYRLTANDVGHTIRSVVTASNSGGSASATSPASGMVGAPSVAPPANSAAPAISGQAVQGQTLTTSNGSWTNSPTSYGYQWQDCNGSGTGCSNISGATAASYTLTSADVGHTLVVVVTATNSGGSASKASGPTATVTASTGGGGGTTTQTACAGTAGSKTPNYASLDACGYPSPNTSGVPAGTTLTPIGQAKLPAGASWSSGELDITGNNVTISGLDINGNVHITGVGDSIINSYIHGSGDPEVLIYDGASNTVMQHDEVTAPSSTIGAINNASGNPFTLSGSYLHNNCTGTLGVGTFHDNYMITDANVSSCHVEDGYVPGGTTAPTDYEHNTLLNPVGQTASIFLDNHAWGPNHNVTINNNLMGGGGYVTYGDTSGDGSTNINITNNRFTRLYYPDGGYYGAEQQNNAATTFSGNIWDDTLAAVKPNS